MSDTSATASVPESLPDRSTMIKVFGVVQIVLGALAALMVPLSLLGTLMGGKTGMTLPPRMQLLSACNVSLLYGGVAALFIWTGVGLVRLRRWAGAVSLVFSALWLAVGAAAMCYMAVMLPTMMRAIEQNAAAAGQPIKPETLALMKTLIATFGLLILGAIYIVIPGVLTFFHSRPSVRQTLAAHDPEPAWTDACPLPVLGMAAFFVLGALGCLSGAVMGLFPAFGVILSGWAGSLVMLASGALLAWLAWGFYRLRMQAWWAGLGWILVSGVSTTYTFTQIGMDALYEKMGMSGEALNMMLRMAPTMELLGWYSAVVAAITTAYLFYLLRFFQRATKAA